MRGQSVTAVVRMCLCLGASFCAFILWTTEEGGRSRATLSGLNEMICAGFWLATGHVCPLVRERQRVWLLIGTCL